MNTTALIRPPVAPGHEASPSVPEDPTFSEMVGELVPLVDVFMVVAATVLVALSAAILAVPYLLVDRLRRHRAPHARSNDHAAQLVPIESPRVVA
jgi:hypothetical protein